MLYELILLFTYVQGMTASPRGMTASTLVEGTTTPTVVEGTTKTYPTSRLLEDAMRSYKQMESPEYRGLWIDEQFLKDPKRNYGYWNEDEFLKRPLGYRYQKKKIVFEILAKFIAENLRWEGTKKIKKSNGSKEEKHEIEWQMKYNGSKAFEEINVTTYSSKSKEDFQKMMREMEFTEEEIQTDIFGKAMTHKQFALVDFANEVLGGSVWGNGSAQEEKLFMEHPHLMLVIANVRREKGFSHERGDDDRSKQLLIPQKGDGTIIISPTPRLAELSIGFKIDKDAEEFNTFDIVQQAEQAPYVVAMAAISFKKEQFGAYSIEELETLLKRAYTGFSNLKAHLRPEQTFAIETGPWGSGDFMNNYGVMYIIQILAAKMAGVERLDYFHRPGKEHEDYQKDAAKFLEDMKGKSINECLSQLHDFAEQEKWFRGNSKL